MILELLKKRSSVKNFASIPIPENILADILEAGRLSPSGGNEQPWKFGVITDKKQIELLAQATYNQTWINKAPLLIVLCCIIIPDIRGARNIQQKRFPKWGLEIANMDKELYSCLNLEEHQTKIPGTHMILQAMEYGIYSNWISYFDVQKTAEILELPQFCIPSEIIAFGYSVAEPSPRKKKQIEDLIFFDKYTKPENH